MTDHPRPILVGVSLKMYFGHVQTLDWCSAVAGVTAEHHALRSGAAELFVIPGYLSVTGAVERLRGVASVGGQDLATEDAGAFTGEVSGAALREVGCEVVEVGHAERRRLFGETPDVVRAKTTAALRNGLAPVLCIGEATQEAPEDAAASCIDQLDDALAGAVAAGIVGRVIVAYEPHWAIGAAEPAAPDHIRTVCARLRGHLDALAEQRAVSASSAVIYGGSAGPGLLATIGDAVDGLFLGRFAHDPAALALVLDEAAALRSTDADLPR
ncbi:triosephosphate isomerase [Plantibacter sp. VKM Ac-2880]|uniref:triose-phosphate isomerase family protein n=1 Tax=Plantibacter sp. VKM Ac-2880 TaxID=2783827 RepID=UPI0018900039|nr:triose-phosphate isomerase family protein [Plantibacter sp. VKM Ac-2880]MBF4570426.1 triosephosphate isomerase [Plantibacter sp. VKM Ac-2880]